MTLVDGHEKLTRNKDLYNALMRGDGEGVIQLCRGVPDGPLHILTGHDDTVLHMATYSEQNDLVLKLLEGLPEDQFAKLKHPNDIGNTILHEAATSDKMVPAAREMLWREPELLFARSQHQETPVFRAARYGNTKIFKFLEEEINRKVASEEERRALMTDGKTTIFHTSIVGQHFNQALYIASKYEYLVAVRDAHGMTGLQLLACDPSAFKSVPKQKSLHQLVCSCFSTEDTTVADEVEGCHDSALRLAKFLIERDTSWEATESALGPGPKTHIYSGVLAAPEGRGGPKLLNSEKAKTPLLLAAKYGCAEIVEEILRMYPQAVEHVDDKGRNILHVAIQYRQEQIFHVVEKMKFPMKRLTRKIDNKGNSILHMVGIDKQDQEATDMRSPGLRLQENLLLFEIFGVDSFATSVLCKLNPIDFNEKAELPYNVWIYNFRLKKASKTEFIMHLNSEGLTAEKLFAVSNAELRRDAKDWMKLTAEHCSIVAVFIATVAFAAAYTVPGGPNQTTGYPILLHQPFFLIFAITNVLSLTFALTSVIAFLSILTSPFRLEDFKHNLPRTLMIGFTLLIVSVLMLMLAFAATIFLMIHNKRQWAKISLSSLAFLPATFFVFLYLRFYVSLMEPFKHSVKMLGSALPQCNSVRPHCSWITNLVSRRHKLDSTVPANRA